MERTTGKYRPAGVAAALLCMVLFLGALAARFWASEKAAAIIGPDHIAADHVRVYVHFNGELFVLSRSGDLKARHPLATVIADDQLIDLRVLPEGNLLLARRSPAGLYTCEPAPWDCRRMALPVTDRLRDQYKVFPDKAGNRLLVSDFASDRLWSQPLSAVRHHLTAANQMPQCMRRVSIRIDLSAKNIGLAGREPMADCRAQCWAALSLGPCTLSADCRISLH